MKKTILSVASILSLAVLLIFPVAFFLGRMSESSYKLAFILVSLVSFVLAVWRDNVANKPGN